MEEARTTVEQQLTRAVRRTGNLAHLREILFQTHETTGLFVATDHNIYRPLCMAAQLEDVEACRLLLDRLSPSGIEEIPPGVIYAAASRIDVLRLLIEYNCNHVVNHINAHGYSTLYLAAGNLEAARFLLENGADPNPNTAHLNPLYSAIHHHNNTEVVRLLLEYGADPNLNRDPANNEVANSHIHSRCTDAAIMKGNSEILSTLLGHGAFVGIHPMYCRDHTSLNFLLSNPEHNRETKLTICRMLGEHAQEDRDTALFLRCALENEVNMENNERLELLFESGFGPSHQDLYFAIQEGNESICQLMVRYGSDPFLQRDVCTISRAPSAFHAAARKQDDTSILLFFLDHWDERFSSSAQEAAGKNDDGNFPIHVLCCDPYVSLEAIKLVATRQAPTLMAVDGEEGLLPLHFAAMWNTKLDVIFYLLKHCPDALVRLQRHGLMTNDKSQNVHDHGDSSASTTNAEDRQQHPLLADNSTTDQDSDDGTDDKSNGTQLQASGPPKKKARTTT